MVKCFFCNKIFRKINIHKYKCNKWVNLSHDILNYEILPLTHNFFIEKKKEKYFKKIRTYIRNHGSKHKIIDDDNAISVGELLSTRKSDYYINKGIFLNVYSVVGVVTDTIEIKTDYHIKKETLFYFDSVIGIAIDIFDILIFFCTKKFIYVISESLIRNKYIKNDNFSMFDYQNLISEFKSHYNNILTYEQT